MEFGFKDAVKLIHPDINPNVENVSEKMTQILANRKDGVELHRLASEWGLIYREVDISSYQPQVTDDVVETPVVEVVRARPEAIITEVNGATITVNRSMFGDNTNREPEWISSAQIEQQEVRAEQEFHEHMVNVNRMQEEIMRRVNQNSMGWEQIAMLNGWTPPDGWRTNEPRSRRPQVQPQPHVTGRPYPPPDLPQRPAAWTANPNPEPSWVPLREQTDRPTVPVPPSPAGRVPRNRGRAPQPNEPWWKLF